MLRFRTRTISLFFAVLLTLGATSQCLSALLCEAGFCAEGCAMAAPNPVKESCCPEKAPLPEPAKKADCCCEWKAAPDALPASAAVTGPLAFDLPFDVAEPTPLPVAVEPSGIEHIIVFSDSSPPPEPCSSQHDRAPPAA